jgi:hypothetical protein
MRTTESLDRGVPFGQYEYVDITFGTADTDVRIRHQLKAAPLTEVYYLVVKTDRATVIYTGTETLWDQQHIVLKSNVANAVVTLLLFTRKL